MADLPSLDVEKTPSLSYTASTVSAADIERPFNMLAAGLEKAGENLERGAAERAAYEGMTAVQRNRDGTLTVDTRPGSGPAASAYNRAAVTAFVARRRTDAITDSIRIRSETKNDPEAFAAAWESYSESATDTAAQHNDILRGPVQNLLAEIGGETNNAILSNNFKQDAERSTNQIKATVASLNDEMSTLARSGGVGTIEFERRQQDVQDLLVEMASNPALNYSQADANAYLRETEQIHLREAMVGRVEREYQTNGLVGARKLTEQLYADPNIDLAPEERRQFLSLANSVVTGLDGGRRVELQQAHSEVVAMEALINSGADVPDAEIADLRQRLGALGGHADYYKLGMLQAARKMLPGIPQMRPGEMLDHLRGGGLPAQPGAPAGASLVEAMVSVESGGDPNAVSPKGARGLMQVMPGTAREIARELGDAYFPITGEADVGKYLSDPEINKRYGTHYLNKQLQAYGGDVEAALIAYNAGPARADAFLAAGRDYSVLPQETRDYVPKVLAAHRGGFDELPPLQVRSTLIAALTSDKGESHIDGLNASFASRVAAMIEAAPPDIRAGLQIYSGHRSEERQAELWSAAIEKYGSEDAARKWVAPPGKSQHNKGNAADLKYASQKVREWVHANAGQFGLAFPLGNEPWHVEAAEARGAGSTTAGNPIVTDAIRKEFTAIVRDDFEALQAGALKGFVPAEEQTDFLAQAVPLITDTHLARQISEFLPTAERAADLQQAGTEEIEAAKLAADASAAAGATAANLAWQSFVTSLYSDTVEGLEKDAMGLAVRRRVIEAPKPLNWKDSADGLAAQFGERARASLRVQGHYKLPAPPPALLPEEVNATVAWLPTQTPGEQASVFANLYDGLPPDVYRSTLAKLAEKPAMTVTAAAGAVYADAPEVAASMLRGQAALAENPALAPKADDATRMEIDELLPPQSFPANERVRQTVFAAATAIYADLSHQSSDTSGKYKPDRFKAALNQATGGVLEGYNGEQIVAPAYGLTQDQFDSLYASLPQEGPMPGGAHTMDGRPFTWQDFRRVGVLRNLGQNTYMIAVDDSPDAGFVMDNTGRRYGFSFGSPDRLRGAALSRAQ